MESSSLQNEESISAACWHILVSMSSQFGSDLPYTHIQIKPDRNTKTETHYNRFVDIVLQILSDRPFQMTFWVKWAFELKKSENLT